jgi:hypothetical protein
MHRALEGAADGEGQVVGLAGDPGLGKSRLALEFLALPRACTTSAPTPGPRRSLYQAKLAAHPGATEDERMRLLAEARAEYEGLVGVQYFDTTFSVDKTISLGRRQRVGIGPRR